MTDAAAWTGWRSYADAALAPNVPVLLMSGYSDQDVWIRCSGANANGFIQKPFDPRELVARVVDLLPSGLRTG